MTIAIISDIHANLEALDAVLAEIHNRAVEKIICLGDVVGYGPDPVECLRKVTEFQLVVAGDWDQAIFNHDPTQWSESHNRHIEWTRQKIKSAPDGKSLLDFLTSFVENHTEQGCQFCHGAPNDVRDFLFPEDLYNQRKLERIAKEFEQTLFAGHTHIPGLMALSLEGDWHYIEAESGEKYDIHNYAKLICNVGSVGQPRDTDPRASFVIFDGRTIQFNRIEYDVDTTVAKIKDDPDLGDYYGDRLPQGR